jgi:hypothetical protein
MIPPAAEAVPARLPIAVGLDRAAASDKVQWSVPAGPNTSALFNIDAPQKGSIHHRGHREQKDMRSIKQQFLCASLWSLWLKNTFYDAINSKVKIYWE